MGENNSAVGFFLIGMALGLYLPAFQTPVDFLNTWLGLVLIVIAVIVFVK